MAVSSTAPVIFSDPRSASASKSPTIPPDENAPCHGRHSVASEKAVQTLRNNRSDPLIFTHGLRMSSERIQRHASIHNSSGIPNAPRPSTWKQKSEAYDP